MISPDEFYKNIERNMSKGLSSFGEMENSMQQHMGRFYNHDPYASLRFEEALGNIEKVMKGEHGNRWDGQNKVSDFEKMKQKYKEENDLD